MISTAIVLAGGLGTRLKGVLKGLPKPMAPIRHRPFLEYQMDFWISQGVTKFILSVGYLNQVIIDHFGDSYNTASIDYIVEDEPLGTGGALLLASQGLTEAFLVLNGDTFFEVDLNNFFEFHTKQKSELTLSLFKLNQLDRYLGVNLKDDGKILSLQFEGNEFTPLVNGGVYLVNPSALKRLNYKSYKKSSLEDDLLPKFISLGSNLYGFESSGKFIDIGVPEDYYRAQKILQD
jgi:D-glycero-alpha-D-manno-heptose 1-phosphate guanylyltransferase